MLRVVSTVARKELVDHVRDVRSLASAGLYALMGPAVVGLIMIASSSAAARGGDARGAAILPVMAAVFTLVAAFSGSMSVSMDMIAGERERRSLLPLLVNAVSRRELIVGKWLAASVFAAVGALATLGAFAGLLAGSSTTQAVVPSVLSAVPPLVSLAVLAAALELVVSTQCRNVKEANAYLSLLVFVVMGIGMWLAFRSEPASSASFLVPIVGQQRLLELAFAGDTLALVEVFGLTMSTLAAAFAALAWAARALRRDAVVYGL